MNIYYFIFAVFAGVANIALNEFVKRAANVSKTSFIDAIFSLKFLFAYGVGTVSIVMLFIFYYNADKFNLAQALILLGSTSIVLGTLFGVVLKNDSIEPVELLILLTLVILYTYKYAYRT